MILTLLLLTDQSELSFGIEFVVCFLLLLYPED